MRIPYEKLFDETVDEALSSRDTSKQFRMIWTAAVEAERDHTGLILESISNLVKELIYRRENVDHR